MACGVSVNIRAKAERIWSLLIDAKDFPRWNSTITSVEGHIREGERLRLHVPGTGRTFAPMPRNDGSTDFAMEERFSGLILPLVKGSLPDFGPVFGRYASDLKNEAERVNARA